MNTETFNPETAQRHTPAALVFRSFEALADLAQDVNTPTPDRFAEMHDEPFIHHPPAANATFCDGKHVKIITHSPNSVSAVTVPCHCDWCRQHRNR